MHALKTNLKCRMAKIRLVGNRLIEDFLHKSKKILQMFSQFIGFYNDFQALLWCAADRNYRKLLGLVCITLVAIEFGTSETIAREPTSICFHRQAFLRNPDPTLGGGGGGLVIPEFGSYIYIYLYIFIHLQKHS